MEKETEKEQNMFHVAFWLGKNLIECPEGGNTSLETIFKSLREEINNDEEQITCRCVSGMVSKMFPNSKKSTVRSQTTGKPITSFKNLLINSCKDEEVIFKVLHKMVPQNWFVFKMNTDEVIFGYFFELQFNGRKPFLQLIINKNNKILVKIDNKEIDCSSLLIPSAVELTSSSIASLFRCMKLINPCQGYIIKSEEEKQYGTSPQCTIETFQDGIFITNILRHKDCSFISPLNSINKRCKKCEKHIKYRHYNAKKDDDKENTYCFSQEEIKDKLRQLAPNLQSNQLNLIESQILNSNTSKKGVRWDKDIICMSLTLYNRNPAAYRDITTNNWLHLPSESLLQRYKNAVQQKPGIIHDMMLWMNSEAKSQQLSREGFYGGIILDEMSIQEDLQIVHYKSETNLVGLSNSGSEVQHMQVLRNGKSESELADHVLQYVFSGLTGFRWPFANFPNTQAPPANIFVTFWTCVDALYSWGFKPIYTSLDGSANNRAFIKMHFPSSNPVNSKMVAKSYKNPTRSMIFMMDPCHLIKKIRNSVLSSGFLDSHQRILTVNKHVIIWKMWVDAYQWDCTNSFRIHHKLSDEHIFPSNAQKMRNKLAFQTLDSDMYNLMTCYSDTLNSYAKAEMVSVLEFLKYTSALVSFFTDSRPIKDMCDPRLKLLSEIYNFFKAWESEHLQGDEKKRNKSLITMETREDIDFTYHGFMSLVKVSILEFKIDIVPSRINSDIIENIFCQQRALYHGANTNPNYNEYRTGINSIILGQTTTSKKSNVGGTSAKPLALSLPPKRLKLDH